MENINNFFIQSMVIGFLASWVGLGAGISFSFLVNKKGRRFQGTMLGFTAGLMISVVCFDLLPQSFEIGSLYIGVFGIVLGLFVSAFLDGKLENIYSIIEKDRKQKFIKMAFLLSIAFAIHNIPEGIALGSLLSLSLKKGLRLGIILSLHCIPEGLAIGIPLKQSSIKNIKIFLFTVAIATPLALGSALGAILSTISSYVISISLGFSGGIMLYITCGEILPESKSFWKGRLSTIGSILGIITGICITALIE